MVGDIANVLSEFATTWVTTPSDYDVLFATTVRHDWARRHRPVLSRGENEHYLYTGFHITEPHGMIVRCHQQACGIEARVYDVKGKTVSFRCKRCKSSCVIDKVILDRSSTLGASSLVRVAYPPDQVKVQWTFGGPAPRSTLLAPPTLTHASSSPELTLGVVHQPRARRSTPTLGHSVIPAPIVAPPIMAPPPDQTSLGIDLPGPCRRSHSAPQTSTRSQKRENAPPPLDLSASPPPNPSKRRKKR